MISYCCLGVLRDVLYVFARDRVDNVVWRCTQELRDDGELVDVILAGEEGLALEHLGKDTAGAPNVDLNIVLLPGKHDLRRTVVSRRHISCHLRILDSRQAEIADLQIAVLINQDVARLQVSVDDAGRVDVFQTTLFIP